MKKEFIQTFRDKRMVAIIFVVPIIQLFLFGYAVTTDVKNINIGLLDRDRSEQSRELLQNFLGSGYFTFQGTLDNDDQLQEALYKGLIDMALVVPANYSENLARGEQATVQALYDASDANFAQIAYAYTARVIESMSRDKINAQFENLRAMAAMSGFSPPDTLPSVNPQMRIWYNPELKSVFYMVPGVICMLLMIVTMILTGMAVTREREIGTIEQIVVSPIASWELILGKIAPFAILGFVDVGLIVSAGAFQFHVPIHGSIVLLFVASGLFLFTTLGLGLLFSTISTTQQQAMFVNFMFIMPAILLSGFMFPIENMPDLIQYITYLNPLRYFLIVIRGIFLKGNGLDILWPQLAALLVFGIIIFSLASARFSKRLA